MHHCTFCKKWCSSIFSVSLPRLHYRLCQEGSESTPSILRELTQFASIYESIMRKPLCFMMTCYYHNFSLLFHHFLISSSFLLQSSINWLGKRITFEWIGVEFNNMRSERRLANPSQACEYSNLNGCGMWYVVGCGARRIPRTGRGKSLGPLGYMLHTGPTLVLMHTRRLGHADAGIHANTSVPN